VYREVPPPASENAGVRDDAVESIWRISNRVRLYEKPQVAPIEGFPDSVKKLARLPHSREIVLHSLSSLCFGKRSTVPKRLRSEINPGET
jgi:hypothetical protein